MGESKKKKKLQKIEKDETQQKETRKKDPFKFKLVNDTFWDKKILIARVPYKEFSEFRIFHAVKGRAKKRVVQEFYADDHTKNIWDHLDENERYAALKPGKVVCSLPLDLVDEIFMHIIEVIKGEE